jgi:branched-chain amino acid transport system ATP-binding protein
MTSYDSMATGSALQVFDVFLSFGGLAVLKGLSLELQQGERLTLIGPNGAGKTTLFNVISGALRPQKGRVLLQGRDVSRLPTFKRSRLGLGRGFQITNLFPELTVWDTAVMALVRRRRGDYTFFRPLVLEQTERAEVECTLRDWRFSGMLETRVRELSYGEQRRLDICLTLMMNPSVLLLDEPTAGLSGEQSNEVLEIVRQLPRSLSCLVVTHDLQFGFGVADQVVGMVQGEIVTQGTPDQVRQDELLRTMYF